MAKKISLSVWDADPDSQLKQMYSVDIRVGESVKEALSRLLSWYGTVLMTGTGIKEVVIFLQENFQTIKTWTFPGNQIKWDPKKIPEIFKE